MKHLQFGTSQQSCRVSNIFYSITEPIYIFTELKYSKRIHEAKPVHDVCGYTYTKMNAHGNMNT